MTGTIVVLIIIGVVFLLGSFFVQDKLSNRDMEQIAQVSENEINMIMERKLQRASSEIEDKVDTAVEETYDATRRAIEKETNEKIMAISEYSDTVIESVNKSHNEIMFLYSMLNDKHTELTNLANELSEFSAEMRRKEEAIRGSMDAAPTSEPPASALSALGAAPGPAPAIVQEPSTQKEPPKRKATKSASKSKAKPTPVSTAEPAVKSPKPSFAAADNDPFSGNSSGVDDNVERSNQEILKLHMSGMSEVDIAKTLGRGLGEVRLVIGLYRGDVIK